MKIYKTIDELPVSRYYKIRETKDLKYLIDKPTTFLPSGLSDIWDNIIDEFESLTGDKKRMVFIAEKKADLNLHLRYLSIYSLMLMVRLDLSMNTDISIEYAKNEGYSIKKVTRDFYNNLRAELLDIVLEINMSNYGSNNNEIIFEEALIRLQEKLGYSIDPDKTSLKMWYYLNKAE